MTKGGYQILDLSGYKFLMSQTQNVPGAFEKIKGTRKVILVSGLNFDGKEYRDAFVNFDYDVGLTGRMYDVVINVSESSDGNDPITITGA